MKRLKPYFLALFLGFNILNAQSKGDSLKIYNVPEIIINEKAQEEQEKAETEKLKEGDLINSLYSGNNVKALELNPIVQRGASNLISQFFIDGVNPDVLGAYYIGNIPILGNIWQQKGISSILDSKIFDNINISNGFYSTKNDALLSTINTNLKSKLNKKFGFELSSNLLDRSISTNIPIQDLNSSVSLYINNKEPLWFIKKNIPETRFFPLVTSFQSHLELFDGKINLAAFTYHEGNDLEENLEENNIKLNSKSIHNIFLANSNFYIGHFNFNTNLGWEEWGNNSEEELKNKNNSKTKINTKNYTINFEVKNNSKNILGFTYTSYTNSKSNDHNNIEYINSLFYQGIDSLSKYLTPESKDLVIKDYESIPENERYKVILDVLETANEVYYLNNHENLSGYPEYINLRNRVIQASQFIGNEKKIDVIKFYIDNPYLISKEILLKTSLSLNKFKDKFAFSFGGELAKINKNIELILSYSHNSSFIKREDIESVLRIQNLNKTQYSDNFSLNSVINFNSKYLDKIKSQVYHKSYSLSFDKDLFGNTKGFNFSLEKKDIFSYIFSAFFGRSELDDKPYLGSIDKIINLNLSYEVNKNITSFTNLRYQDGYWSDRNYSGNYQKLGNSLNLDVGSNFSFNIFKEKDLHLSLGIYNLLGNLRDNPIFVYSNSQGVYTTIKAPITGTLQLDFNY